MTEPHETPHHVPDRCTVVCTLGEVPHRLLLEMWHQARAQAAAERMTRRAALSWLRATIAGDPVRAHAARAASLPAEDRERHLRARGIDQH